VSNARAAAARGGIRRQQAHPRGVVHRIERYHAAWLGAPTGHVWMKSVPQAVAVHRCPGLMQVQVQVQVQVQMQVQVPARCRFRTRWCAGAGVVRTCKRGAQMQAWCAGAGVVRRCRRGAQVQAWCADAGVVRRCRRGDTDKRCR